MRFPLLSVALAACAAVTLVAATPVYPPEVLANMNLTADPCNDFYEYACGAWIASTVLSPTEAFVFKSITTIQDNNDAVESGVLQNNSYALLRPMYDNCMDRTTIDSLGVAPLQPYRYLDLGSLNDVAAAAGKFSSYGIAPLFTFSAVADALNPSTVIGQFDQGGFALFSRDLYLSPSQLLTDYQTHVAKMFTLLDGDASAAAVKAAAVLRVETKLAQFSLPADQIRDPVSMYNPVNLTGLNDLAPNFPWGLYFESSGINVLRKINIAEPVVIQQIDAYLATAPITDLIAYLDWCLLHSVATNGLLPEAFVTENFAFLGMELEGQTAIEPLNGRCVDLTNNYLGDLLSQYFVDIAFAGNSQTVATTMVDTIISTFMQVLQNVTWMDAGTKSEAITKENLLAHRVGFPSNPNTYSDYTVTPKQHLTTVMSFNYNQFQDGVVALLFKPANRNAWAMFADIVNAYYDAPTNSLTIPAGIMQPPYFSAQNDPALNFGGVGVIIGHENSHGFDDQGREYDGTGTLRNWWAPATLQQFEERTTCMINQYSAFEVLPGVYVNGNLTIGENIADNGGVKTAYNAYLASVTTPNPNLFFVAYAQGWCSVATPEFLRNSVASDVHSPAKFRAIGPVMNRPEFAAAFNCPVGSVMNPTTQCEIW